MKVKESPRRRFSHAPVSQLPNDEELSHFETGEIRGYQAAFEDQGKPSERAIGANHIGLAPGVLPVCAKARIPEAATIADRGTTEISKIVEIQFHQIGE